MPVLWLSWALHGQLPADIFVDPRDGLQYKTVQIGDQIWMAENLNYGGNEKVCYDHDPGNCSIYGGLYTWETAATVCPEGWRLPSREDWTELSEFLGVREAGQKLKAAMGDVPAWDGTNESGFSAIPAGAGNGEEFQRMGDWALFWSSSEFSDQRAWFAQLDGYWYPAPPKYRNLYVGWYYLKSNQFSVRCIKSSEN